ncbi:MAG: hypothetical protein NVS1B3_11590 [Candidatus Dormibacteraceae bacterium]
MLQRAFEAAADQPGVERVMAVLDQNRTVSETQEGAPGVPKLRGADKHRAVDVMAAMRIRVDRRLTVDQRVEEGERAVEPKALGADFQDEKRRVTGGLDVQGDKLRFVQSRLRPHLRRVDGDLLPWRGLRTARLEENWFGPHRLCASARRAQAISSVVNPRSNRTAPA